MKKEQMVGTRLPSELVRELKLIEDVEQSDRSTTVRQLLSKAIRQWKLEHYARLYGDGKLTLARAAAMPACPCGRCWTIPAPERYRPSTTSKISGATWEPSPATFSAGGKFAVDIARICL